MRIGLLFKENDDKSKEFAKRFAELVRYECGYADDGFVSDIIICFGGDGTTLKACRYAAEYGAKVISLNTGSTGFLSSYEKDDFFKLVEAINEDCQFEYDAKYLIKAEYDGNSCYAINEIFVRGSNDNSFSRSSSLNVAIGGVCIGEYRCDGFIISTPTGSTAYSLSAGGAIVTPELNALIATPVCAHILSGRCIVFSDKEKVVISSNEQARRLAIYNDGVLAGLVENGSYVIISKSDKQILVAKGEQFFKKLSKKLHYLAN